MECCQNLHRGSGRNSGLQIPSNSAGGSAWSVVKFALRKETTVPIFKNKNIQLQSSCCTPLSSSMSQVQVLEIWSPCRGYTERHLLQLVQNILVKHFQSPILDISCFVTNFKLWVPVVFFPLHSAEESILSPVLRVFWGTSRFNFYKSSKWPTYFSLK